MIQRLKNSKYTYFAPAIAWGFFVAYMTLLPATQIPQGLKDLNDKFIHAGVFFFTASLIILAYRRFNLKRRTSVATNIGIFLFCVLYGGSIELLQHYLVPLRQGDWLDFWANNLGALASVLGWSVISGRRA